MYNHLGKVEYRLRRYRRLSQVGVLLLLVLSPFLHIFRFDVPTTSLYLFGIRLWFKHFFLFSLLVTVVIYIIIAVSFVFGRLFCGWVCPQNLFNELGRVWDKRFGRTGTILLSALISTFGGFVLWSYGTDGAALLRQYLNGEVPLIPTVTILSFSAFFTSAMAWWRTDICKVACPYGHLQAIISNRSTMHLALFNLPENRDICSSCGLCSETCHIDVDPRTADQKHCVACGDCLDACQLVSDARRVPRILNYEVGFGDTAVRIGSGKAIAGVRQLLPRLILPMLLAAVLTGITAFGLANRSRVDLVVSKDHRAVFAAGGTVSGAAVMRVSLVNLGTRSETFMLSAEGLPGAWAKFEQEHVVLAPGQEAAVVLRILPGEYRKGLYPFDVRVVGETTGVTETFRTVYAMGN